MRSVSVMVWVIEDRLDSLDAWGSLSDPELLFWRVGEGASEFLRNRLILFCFVIVWTSLKLRFLDCDNCNTRNHAMREQSQDL